MLVIRLRRTGKKHQATYRIVVTDQRKSVYSPYIEMIGQYNPKTKAVVLDKEKALEWMKKGAKPSNTVSKILKKQEVEHSSIVVKKYRAVSKKELETQKVIDEKEKEQEQAEKEAAKEAFEAKVEEEKKEAPAEDRLQSAAEESIQDIKEEEKEEPKPEIEEKADNSDNSDNSDEEKKDEEKQEPAKE